MSDIYDINTIPPRHTWPSATQNFYCGRCKTGNPVLITELIHTKQRVVCRECEHTYIVALPLGDSALKIRINEILAAEQEFLEARYRVEQALNTLTQTSYTPIRQ